MIGWCQDGHLMPTLRVCLEETLHFVCNLPWRPVIPLDHQSLKHGERSAAFDFSKLTELVKLSICHTHILLVILSRISRVGVKWLQLSRWLGFSDLLEDGKIVLCCEPGKEFLQVSLVNATDGVQVTRATVILGQVPV